MGEKVIQRRDWFDERRQNVRRTHQRPEEAGKDSEGGEEEEEGESEWR